METKIEKRPRYIIGTQLDKIAEIISTAEISVQDTADNIDDSEIFPTIESIRSMLQIDINDLKNALAQLENVDAQLKKMNQGN